MTATARAIKEKPILFSGPMVRAILEGRKTQTRRVVIHQKRPLDDFAFYEVDGDEIRTESGRDLPCRYGQPGDHLWVRETFADSGPSDNRHIVYKADFLSNQPDLVPYGGNWRPSIFMPRKFSRITLEITRVRVERLQDITTRDCEQEGIQYPVSKSDVPGKVIPLINVSSRYSPLTYLPKGDYGHDELMRAHWACGWNELNAKRGYSWESNPWVWAITFRKL